MKFKVGVIGATGFIGTPYRKEIREAGEDAEIVALCARRRDRLEAAGKEDGAQLITDDWRQVVEHPDVNLVIVATPDALHYDPVLACAEQGKHVFCDKPVGANVGQAYEMWAAYRDAKLGHYVPYWTRFLKVFARTREIVAQGTLGEIKAVVCRWQNPRPMGMPFTWRDNAELSASGSIGDVGSHAYDTVRWIIGEEARRVLTHAGVITPAKPDLGEPSLGEALEWGQAHSKADSSSLRKGTAIDYADILVEFASGAVGSFKVSHAPYVRKGLAPELELHGTEASLSVDRISGTITLARPDEAPRVIETGIDMDLGNRFVQHVFPAVRQRSTGSPCDDPGLHDGWRVQMFADAAAISAKRGTWVELAELDAERE